AQYPNHSVIITTHCYLYRDGTTLDANDVAPATEHGGYNNGDHMWDKLIKKYKNIQLVISGHDPSDYVIYSQQTGDNGNVVNQLLIDPQSTDLAVENGTGMITMLYFSDNGNRVQVRTYSIVQEKWFMDDNQFEFTMDTLNTSASSFTQWTENLNPVYHVGLSTATASDTNFGQYRYIAQPFVPAEDTVYGFELPLNITAGEARIHTEIRATLDSEALAYGDTVLARKGVSMQWYQADLRAPLTVTPGKTYYLVYYLTARDSGSLCIAYGTDLGANKATYPGAVWQMSSGTPITFTTQNNQLQFGFKLLSRRQMPEDQDNVYTILAASDFQTHGKSLLQTGQYDVHEACTEGAVYLKNMMTSVVRDHSDIDAFFFGGDLSHGAANDDYTRIGRQYLEETMLANGLTPEAERIYITGNHETTQEDMAFFTASGGYDKGPYGLFVINDENHPYHLSDRSQLEQITKNTAKELEAWLNTQTPGEKPIFVLSHIQLHYGTPTIKADDGLYAQYFVDVLNRAGQKGHNIIFLFGHNHAGGYDTFLGGSTNFMTKGETLWVSKPGDATAAPVANDLYFTYMNYGYLGYYDATTGDNAFTMTVFEIQDSKVTVKRYDQQGRHGVQPVAGKYWVSNVHDDTNYGYQPDTVTAEYGYEIGKINGFTYWAQDLSPLYHVGLSTATASDTNWDNYRYIAQPFVPETETLRGVQLPLNITHGTATIHLEIRSAIDGEAIASGDTDVTHLGSGMQWYEAMLEAPATLQPGKTYYLVYYLTARSTNSLCIAYGTDLGANKATHPGAVWKMADGEPVTFTTQSNQLHFGFKLLADSLLSEDQIAANEVIDSIDNLEPYWWSEKASVQAVRTAYDALTEEQKALVDNYNKLLSAEAKIAEMAKDIEEGTARILWHDFDNTGDSNAPAGMSARWMKNDETISGIKSLAVKTNEGQKTVNQYIIPQKAIDASMAAYVAFDLYCSRDIAGSEIADAGINVGDLNTWTNGGSVAVLATTLKQNGLKKGWNSFILPVQWSNATYDKTQIRCGRIYIVFNQIEAGVEFSYDDVAFASDAGHGVLVDHNQAKIATTAIRAIPAVDSLTKEDKALVDEAAAAYSLVKEACVSLVKDTDKLTAAQAKMNELYAADLVFAEAVQEQIEALIVDSLDDKIAVEAAREAYDALSDVQKGLVANLDKLLAAEAKIAQLEQAAALLYGDVDGDGRVSAADALEVLKAVVGNITLTDEQTVFADVDGDEKISSVDALYILKKVVGKIDTFPVQE
ncbi:MAG: metallophosphoesterase, partial [Clostridia bacterium]|nr:metallophosphoesterase [Clostridia bacterium]